MLTANANWLIVGQLGVESNSIQMLDRQCLAATIGFLYDLQDTYHEKEMELLTD